MPGEGCARAGARRAAWPLRSSHQYRSAQNWREGRRAGGGACGKRFLQSAWRAAQVSQRKKQIKINKRQVLNDTDYDIKKGCR